MKTLLTLLAASVSALAADPWADSVYDYSPGTLQSIGPDAQNQSLFNDPSQALGPITASAGRTVASTEVVQLGQRGSITLGFNEPILNNIADASSSNPLGYDFTVFGNAIELAFAGSGAFYREPGFVEVAKRSSNGQPIEWFLLLPAKLPSALVGGVDTGASAPAIAGYADENYVLGTGDPLLPPSATDSAGGDGFMLEQAVRQASPGVPIELSPGVYDFVALASVDFVRITDALASDSAAGTGMITTDIDAVIDLPGTVPEPSVALLMLASTVLIARRSRR